MYIIVAMQQNHWLRRPLKRVNVKHRCNCISDNAHDSEGHCWLERTFWYRPTQRREPDRRQLEESTLPKCNKLQFELTRSSLPGKWLKWVWLQHDFEISIRGAGRTVKWANTIRCCLREVDSQALGSFEALRQQRIPYKDSRGCCLLFINHSKRALDTWYCWRNRFSSVQDNFYLMLKHFVRLWRFYPFRVNMHDWISQIHAQAILFWHNFCEI